MARPVPFRLSAKFLGKPASPVARSYLMVVTRAARILKDGRKLLLVGRTYECGIAMPSTGGSAGLALRGLDASSPCEVTGIDAGAQRRFTRSELMQSGIPVAVPHRPGSVIFMYRRSRR